MSFSKPTSSQAVFELVVAAAFWGWGFVAAQWALASWSPAGVLMWRFLGALVLGEILFLCFRARKPSDWKTDFKGALPAGILLGSFLLLQTIGLQYTTASKSGFITTLYVVLVPLANWLFFGRKIAPGTLVMVVGACLGTFLLMDVGWDGFSHSMNSGDLWTLASALLATAHIMYMGRLAKKIQNPFRVNNFQSFWALVTILPVALFLPDLQIAPITAPALGGIVVLAIACSVFAFFLQVRAQRVLSDTTASVLFLLESPYAFVFAYFLLGERLSESQGLGALLILGAALGSVILENGWTSKARAK